MVRGSWRPNRNCNILTPLLRPSALCLSLSPDAQPEARELTLLAFSTISYQQLLWTPTHQAEITVMQFTGHSLPVHQSMSVPWEFYNCHAVHRSLSSGASVYECTMGILACPILLANFCTRDFLS